jgi:hypothetical protein
VSVRRALLAALLTMAAAGPARAFVRSTAQGGNAPLFWKESCVPITIYLNGFAERENLSATQIVKSIAAAAHSWGPDGVTCADGVSHPYLEIVPTLSTSTGPGPTGYDARNSLVFRTDNWTMGGKPNGKQYAEGALAVTTVIARLDGHIVDADMEINATNSSFDWVNLDPGVVIDFNHSTVPHFDIQNAVTHEFGHLIGLDHTCFNPDPFNPKLRPQDDMGNPVPDCSTPEAAKFANTVMFDTAPPLQTSKRILSDDDKRAVCTIYAPTNEHLACTLDSPVGCAVAPAPRSNPVPVLVLALVLVAVLAIGSRRARS